MAYLNYNINLQSKTISDNISATSTTEPTLDTSTAVSVHGTAFTFKIDEYSHNEVRGLYSITGSYDFASRLNDDLAESSFSASQSASSLLSNVVGKIAKETVSHFDDFTPTGLLVKSGTKWVTYETYGSALQKIFGWTSIIPTTQVNVFERGGTIYAIQRGHEPNAAVDITGYCGNVSRNYKTMWLLFNANHDYYLTGEAIDTNQDTDTGAAPDTLYSGVRTDNNNQTTLTYSYGLLRSEHFASTDGTVTSDTTYSYSNFYPPSNLTSKTMTRTETLSPEIPELTESMLPYKVITKKVTTTTLINSLAINGKDLIQSDETTSIVSSGYNIVKVDGTTGTLPDETESHTTSTTYSDLGQNQWVVSSYKDGEFSNSQVVTNNPGCKATPFAVKTGSTLRSRKGGHILPPRVNLGNKFAGNLNINVSDITTLYRIAAAINDLNGKTQEKITLDYYGSAVIDFLAMVTYKGNNYYLDANNITVTPTMTKQSLTLLRWY